MRELHMMEWLMEGEENQNSSDGLLVWQTVKV